MDHLTIGALSPIINSKTLLSQGLSVHPLAKHRKHRFSIRSHGLPTPVPRCSVASPHTRRPDRRRARARRQTGRPSQFHQRPPAPSTASWSCTASNPCPATPKTPWLSPSTQMPHLSADRVFGASRIPRWRRVLGGNAPLDDARVDSRRFARRPCPPFGRCEARRRPDRGH